MIGVYGFPIVDRRLCINVAEPPALFPVDKNI